MSQRFSYFLRKSLLVTLCLLVWACTGSEMAPTSPVEPPPPAPSPAPVVVPPPPRVPEQPATRDPNAPLPQQHTWQPLLEMDSETPDYGMYTYVLFNRRLDMRARLDPESLQRLEELLNAVVSSTLSSAEVGELSDAEKKLTNLIFIPATHRNSLPSLDNYHSVLAMRYLDELNKMIRSQNPQVANRLLTNPGPFLVSTLKPVGKIDSQQTTLLYADLSTTNPTAMAEIVSAYKLRLGRERLNEAEQFAPLRLALLNLVLNADDNIKLVKAALAHWVPE